MQGNAAIGGQKSGKQAHKTVQINKTLDKSSMKLMNRLNTGSTVVTIEFTYVKSGSKCNR